LCAQYDVQPVVRHGRVFLQILWRYKEQQSFYLSDKEWDEHCEAVADLIRKWDAVDVVLDYLKYAKKKRRFCRLPCFVSCFNLGCYVY
jgi:Domain of unknown function (DUF3067)